ncbi:MAG: hypothetical protein RH862_09990 [Leptospiraceae bacterium]
MPQYITYDLTSYAHREFLLEYTNAQRPDVELIADILRTSISTGTPLEPGDKVQIGCYLCRVIDRGDYLGLEEPSFPSDPLEWVDSVDATAHYLRLQKAAAESCNLADDLSFPAITHTAFVCSAIDSAEGIFMDRVGPVSDQDSGWFIACSDQNHDHDSRDNLRQESLYVLSIKKPVVIPFLGFPVGTTAMIKPDERPRVLLHGAMIRPEHDSYLDRASET